jgi:SAM-dependent methyltransferase
LDRSCFWLLTSFGFGDSCEQAGMMVGTHKKYIGNELEIFALARRWKTYFASALEPYINGAVAEVGAGRGATTQALCDPTVTANWLCLEPDEKMAAELRRSREAGQLPARCDVYCGILGDLSEKYKFNTIVYIDVLEHIIDDNKELSSAASHLLIGGRIIVLCPAWPHLYSRFDEEIGHYRRYTRRSLRGVRANGVQVEKAFYLDSVGYLVSLGNKLILDQSMPTKSQVIVWDRVIVPISRVLDPLVFWSFGRSIVTIWKKREDKG